MTAMMTETELQVLNAEFSKIASGIGITVEQLDEAAKRLRSEDGNHRLAYRNLVFGAPPDYVGPCYNPMPETSILSKFPDGVGYFYGYHDGANIDLCYVPGGKWQVLVNGDEIEVKDSFHEAEGFAKTVAGLIYKN